jgi:hypothetical protein
VRHKLLGSLCEEILGEYLPEKRPLFIKAFIDQNAEFFQSDPVIINWLALLETGVSFEEQSTAGHDEPMQAVSPPSFTDESEDVPLQKDCPAQLAY